MKVVTLKSIALVSSTIPENQYQGAPTADGKWAAGSYAQGAVVYYTGAIPHKVYRSIAASNTTIPGTDVAKWTDLGATDRWLMFDEYMNTQSAKLSTFTVVVDAADCDYIGVFNCDATSVTFSLSDGGTVIKTETVSMEVSNPSDHDQWMFWPADFRQRVVWEFPQYSSESTTLTVTFDHATGTAKCGVLAIGKAYELGGTLYKPEIGFNDYSYKYENKTTGAVSMIPGNYSDVGSLKIWLENRMVDFVKRRLIDNRGKVAIYDFNNARKGYESWGYEESMIFYGFPGKIKATIEGAQTSRVSFTMRGMI